ncbi:MAG TPA: translation initiation factor IF-2 N-terminal domain-containing protein, partial [Patescibacteria group bacterium]
MAGRAKKPFVSRKRRREIVEARERRETQVQAQHERTQSEGQQYIRTDKTSVHIPPVATVGEFAQLLKVPVVAVIKQLMKNGIMAAINHSIDFDTMS